MALTRVNDDIKKRFTRGLINLHPDPRGAAVTIGSFDGVHLGHQAILRQVISRAKALNVESVAMVFEPQPHEFFFAEKAPARLMRLREKALALFDAGIDRVVCLHFNAALRKLSSDEFIERILVDGLRVKYLVVGDDFRFGRERAGDVEALRRKRRQYGFEVTDTHTYELDGERVSSTRIRRELVAANFAKVTQLLGKPFTIVGKVGYGQQLGRTLGVPTANVQLRRYSSPISGVFACIARVGDERWNAVANVGIRPTVGGGIKPILEVHLLDFSGNLYGRRMAVEFCHKLRDEVKFDSLDALSAQISQDIIDARDWFAAAAH